MISTPKSNINLRINILIQCLPKYIPIKKPIQQFNNNMIKINLKITFQEMKNHDHINNRKKCNNNST